MNYVESLEKKKKRYRNCKNYHKVLFEKAYKGKAHVTSVSNVSFVRL